VNKVEVKVASEAPREGNFSFSATGDCETDTSLQGDIFLRYRQRLQVGLVEAELRALEILPCEVDVSVIVVAGRVPVIEGNMEIMVANPEYMKIVTESLHFMHTILDKFVAKYPNVGFKVAYSQSVVLTTVGSGH